MLLRAAHHARGRVPGLRLHIVGEGYERPAVEGVIDELDAADWVTLRGHLTEGEKIDLYRGAWIIASASAREGWGMTLTEAAACGTPAVATRIAGHADAIHEGSSGLLAEGDPRSLGDAMADVLTDDELRARLSQGALARAAELTWTNTATQLMRVVADEVSRRRSRR
jgi:glycosyltransferase involved in cell wall biosynthesis